MSRVNVKPELLLWACERSGFDVDFMAQRQVFRKLPDWIREKTQPTVKQLEKFAKATHTPFGYFFLPEPPKESMPIPDLRTIADKEPEQPSPNLLDTIYAMQQRQTWLREERIECEAEPLDIVGSARLTDEPDAVGCEMRRIVRLDDGWASQSEFRHAIERLGVMVVMNGVVGNNTSRILDVKEFRGFALSDAYAPLVFVNGADAKSAQMFTLAHELAHIWLGESALSDVALISRPSQEIERWCNQVAAEFLVPAVELKAFWPGVKHEETPFETIAQYFKISPVVAGRRALDLRLVDRSTFFDFYNTYIEEEEKRKSKPSKGGNFYNSQNTRIGKIFAAQVIRAAMEGRVGFKEAYSLIGLNGGTFQRYARRLGYNLP